MAEQATRPPEDKVAPEDAAEQHDDTKNGGGGSPDTLAHELRQAIRDAALEVLGPAAREATLSAAKYAVSKGPEIVTDRVMPAVSKNSGAAGLAQHMASKTGAALAGSGSGKGLFGKLLSKLGGGRGRGGGAATGWGRGRRMPVQQHVYVSVPVTDAYNGWTEYKQWPRYMHRANQVDAQVNDREARVKVTEKMWGFKRPFTAEVVTQKPDQHIKWNATEGTKHTGVINFHELGPRLTLIEVNLEHSPSGLMEKIARGARFTKRAVRADFHRFQGWIEMKSDDELAELEGWRGTIEGGQIVTSHEDAVEETQRGEEGEPQEREDEQEVAAEADEAEAPEAGEPRCAHGRCAGGAQGLTRRDGDEHRDFVKQRHVRRSGRAAHLRAAGLEPVRPAALARPQGVGPGALGGQAAAGSAGAGGSGAHAALGGEARAGAAAMARTPLRPRPRARLRLLVAGGDARHRGGAGAGRCAPATPGRGAHRSAGRGDLGARPPAQEQAAGA